MKKFKLVVDDTITLQRKWKVEIKAKDLATAKQIALDRAIGGSLGEPDSEDEVDNAPYAVELDD